MNDAAGVRRPGPVSFRSVGDGFKLRTAWKSRTFFDTTRFLDHSQLITRTGEMSAEKFP